MTDGKMTWDGYKSWVSTLIQSKTSFLCRGQSNEYWKLQTTFHREAIHKKLSLLDYLDVIIPDIHYHLCAVHDEIINLRVQEEFGAFLALIQHHGFPTPLLDWTLSPYIAAYFAFKGVNDVQPQSDNVKIYLFDHLQWLKSFEQLYDLRDTSKGFVSILKPYAKHNPRIIAQQGCFTLTNIEEMEQYILERAIQNQTNFLYTALLSVKEKPLVLKELNWMGINEMTLFPSIGGICRGLKTMHFSPDTIGPTLSEQLNLLAKTNLPNEGPSVGW
ncbi:FRG domain-containing protein [uncultured Desulfosarcina sp.]|uniref:FRG domain-containing protein n=1 Tax=uncultured Desulfosarcina sp. TaxID=218289 RepID=UPI0029C657D1|nr:FRG domain-containing protein [uncultured Desulfosarcina sp.]